MKRKMYLKYSVAIYLAVLLVLSCSGNDDDGEGKQHVTKQDVHGIIEKGPFVQGSKVTLYDLDGQLGQTGKSYSTNTSSNLGNFDFGSPIDLSSSYAEFETNGFFYNECNSRLSKAQITLKAIADVSAKSDINVNLLTHLEYARVKFLVKNGKTFGESKRQAERELLKVFAISSEIANPENISITDNNNNASILLAISSVMLYNKSEAEFSEFISKFSADFEQDGTIDDTNVRKEIKDGQKNCDPKRIVNAMKNFYAEKGSNIEVNDFSAYIDFNGDGIINSEDKEIQPNIISFVTITKLQPLLKNLYSNAMEYTGMQLQLEGIRLGQSSDEPISASSSLVSAAWSSGYKTINICITLIDALQSSQVNYDTKPYIDQAKTIMAFVYYNMAMLWGNIPIVKSSDINMHIGQSDALTVYAYCQELLKGVAPVATQQGMVSANFVAALSLEIALAQNNMIEAKSLSPYISNADVFSFVTQEKTIPIYTAEYLNKLKNGVDAETWLKRGVAYGTWAALKRLNKATSLTGVSNNELLLPIPFRELLLVSTLIQNPGY
jgi:hypothetical protein